MQDIKVIEIKTSKWIILSSVFQYSFDDSVDHVDTQ